MKTVVHIVDGKVVRQEVPNDWIQCSVLGEFRPPEEFRSEGKDYQTRTNCTRAYLMPIEEWEQHRATWKKLSTSIEIEQRKIQHERQEVGAGVSVDELIAALVSLKERNPNARIVLDDEMSMPEVSRVHGYQNVYSL